MKHNKVGLLMVLSFVLFCLNGCNGNDKYFVTFKTNGGTKIDSIEVSPKGKIELPVTPVKNGYKFAGWYSDSSFNNEFSFSTNPGKDITLYAKWTLENYTITYNLDNGINDNSNIESYNVLVNDFKLQDPTKEGFSFGGWYLDSAFKNPITTINTGTAKNYTLYAKWTNKLVVVDYNVIYHLDGGTNANTNPSVFNKEQSNILLANPTKDNYKFIGWYSEQAFTNKVSSINTQTESNIDLYAKWEENTTPIAQYYSISYHLNGGKNSNNNPVRFNETTSAIELENPDKASATFQGWFSEDTYENQVTEIDTVNTKQNLHLYAKWLNGVQETIYDLDLGIGSKHVIYQVSDTHVNACNDDYSKKQESGRISGRVNFANSFGEKYNVANLPTVSLDILNNFVTYINAQQPDAVCYTGDIMDYYSKANYEVINTALSNNTQPFVYAPGNHEDPSAVLEGMVGVDTIEFTVREFEDFEVICMDNSSNNGNEDYYFTENQYQLLLAETLKNKPIIIAEHVPLLTEYNCESRLEKCGSYYFIDRNGCDITSQKVVDLICNNDNIKLVLCGHIHGGTQTKLTPTKYQISCASGLIGIINKITIH